MFFAAAHFGIWTEGWGDKDVGGRPLAPGNPDPPSFCILYTNLSLSI